jgi:hypothetical protein
MAIADKRLKKLEDKILTDKQVNTVVLWEGIHKPFIYNDKSYNTKEQLQEEYPSIKFDFITIVWEDGIHPEHQTDKRVIDTLKEFEANY